ncbi:c-type cytochrome [Halomonas sp. CUBES01]|uniref:C-type cytochrome n=1 Tax=Vreelandella gomseomensis TaxID=370766 RepID=A0ABU1GA30_9GAMM|nr:MULTISPECIES: c-type cytochrome [Halomonas]MDR5874348.1 c-type cytochrome [Halomonas gomseomensis]MEC4769006.1 c-type cytochrome [Halomonas sp. CUBES01]MEC4769020.1 c-type cytochrome [Halomonas sp. CUBES01]
MNNKWSVRGLFVLGVAMTGGPGLLADTSDEAIAERLAPVGSVCLQGQDCGTAAAEAQAGANDQSSGGGSDGAALYASTGCAACHDSGAAGAPKLGDTQAWSARLAQGNEALYQSVFNGKGAMPARGGSSASDDEIEAVVDYMVAEAE